MFDLIKRLFGWSDCAGCRHRRLGGLYCGCRKRSRFPHGAWQRYGCWHYAEARKAGRQA